MYRPNLKIVPTVVGTGPTWTIILTVIGTGVPTWQSSQLQFRSQLDNHPTVIRTDPNLSVTVGTAHLQFVFPIELLQHMWDAPTWNTQVGTSPNYIWERLLSWGETISCTS